MGIKSQMITQPMPVKNNLDSNYRSCDRRETDLIHTELDISFNYENTTALGKVILSLKPHFYATDLVRIDAKGMEIISVSMLNPLGKSSPRKFTYDGTNLVVNLGKVYTSKENYRLQIAYISKPNELKTKGSAAITEAKGLYFINPKGSNYNKPVQIWTQGETESTSAWCPTIDRPNQKTTQYFKIRIPEGYVSLSNGLLVKQAKHPDGTRTDEWKMDLPHAPYLSFIGIGDYAIIKDSYKGKEVSYYVEKKYASVAKVIFGNTPEMIGFFSKITGIEYPWPKYSQITGQDYVSGAMENTSCTLHSSDAQQDARELTDGNIWESTIAHELFHHWFGDYVTAESWSNLTLNESFANYSEVLWYETKYGKDLADAQNYSDMTGYFQSGSEKKKLLRFFYNDKEDMFDAVSYNKGGRVLHMLRNYVGDSAFFKSLNLYLTRNKFKSAEVDDLRNAFEEITGVDLNWFFDQWYLEAGHPVLHIDYSYDQKSKKTKIRVEQNQEGGNVFKIPTYIDIYLGNEKERKFVWLQNRIDSFEFEVSRNPDLVNFDGDKVLLAEKTENKTIENYFHQYQFAGKYLDRLEAIEFASRNQQLTLASELMKKALKDSFHGIRILALERTQFRKPAIWEVVEPTVAEIAIKDPKRVARAKALEVLADRDFQKYQKVIEHASTDSSYTVAGSSLESILSNDKEKALQIVKGFGEAPTKGKLLSAKMKILVANNDESAYEEMVNYYTSGSSIQGRLDLCETFIELLTNVSNTAKLKVGVKLIGDLRNAIPITYNFDAYFSELFNGLIEKKRGIALNAGQKNMFDDQISIIESFKKRNVK